MKIYLIRHAETEWNLTHRHTSTTDLPLTKKGIKQAKALKVRLQGKKFDHIFSSPMQRAIETCVNAGFEKNMQIEKDLSEWNYGDYEGKTKDEINEDHPGWSIFSHGAKGGESVEDAFCRAKRFIEKLLKLEGDIILFSHGHFSRVLGASWIGLNAHFGEALTLTNASVSILGINQDKPAIFLWNDTSHLSNT